MEAFIISLFVLLCFDSWVFTYKLQPNRDVVTLRTEMLFLILMNIGVCFIAFFLFV